MMLVSTNKCVDTWTLLRTEPKTLLQQPGTSVAAVTLANGLNANMLRRWVHEAAVDGGTSKVATTGVGGLRAVVDARQDRTSPVAETVQSLDMRLGTEAALARVVGVFGAAHPNHVTVRLRATWGCRPSPIADAHAWMGRASVRCGGNPLTAHRGRYDVVTRFGTQKAKTPPSAN